MLRLAAMLCLLCAMCACGKSPTGRSIDPAKPVIAAAINDDFSPWWQPTADRNYRWYWQLQDRIDTTHNVDVYDIDIDTPQPVIDELKRRGIKLICYFSVGTVESWRTDAHKFPALVVGDVYAGYEDERWLDVAHYPMFSEIITERLDRCAEKGFDGIEGDNIDAFLQVNPDGSSGTSFGITKTQSIDYVRWLASQSHQRGMAFGLKNAIAIAPALINDVDWIITESCFAQGWCDEATLFVEHNKPVFMSEYVEYLDEFSAACGQAREHRFNAIYRDVGLTGDGRFEECL